MPLAIRPANPADTDPIAALLVSDAEARQRADPGLWRPRPDAAAMAARAIAEAIVAENPSFRQKWLVAESDGRIVGASHSIRLPVPPIYAGAFGPPGLIMDDSTLAADAPDDTAPRLLKAAEDDLVADGAGILLASALPDSPWPRVHAEAGYRPLTLYLARSGLTCGDPGHGIRKASAEDVPAIVVLSAANRQVLFEIDPFWMPHADADQRFGAWMERSLGLTDRDMFVGDGGTGPEGYAISQPATPLHFPPLFDIAGIGVIDDWYHRDFAELHPHGPEAGAAAGLLSAAEAALAARGRDTVLVVCPADWMSKKALLEETGHRTALVWQIRQPWPRSGALICQGTGGSITS